MDEQEFTGEKILSDEIYANVVYPDGYCKLKFYFDNSILVKFRLIEPKGHYEVKGKILDMGYENTGLLLLEYHNCKMIINYTEIDASTIFPLDYNPIVEVATSYINDELRKFIFTRDNYECKIKMAGCTTLAEEIDHIIPRSKGGLTIPENLQASCKNCNRKKSSTILN